MDITDELNNLLNPPSSPLDRVIQRREKKERDLINAQLENVAALREIHKANERTKQLDAQVAALGTDSDTVRQVTGGAMSGTGSVIGAPGWIAEQAGRLIESGLVKAGLGDQVRAVNEKFEEWGIAAPSEGFKGLGNWLKEGGQTVQESIRAESQYEIDQSTPTGDVLEPGSWSLGDNPSLEGYALQMSRILGEFAPQAAGLLAKSPETAVKLMGAIGGLQAGEGQASAQVDNIMASDEATLMEASDLYRELREDNPDMTHEQAQQEVARTAGAAAFMGGALVGTAGGAATGYILRPLQGKLQGNVLARGAKSVGLSAAEEATQEVGETVTGRAAANAAAGMDQDLTADTFGDAVLGGSFGGGLGAAATVVDETGRVVDTAIQKNQERLEKEREENVGIVTAIAEGNFDEITAPENREKYPRKVVAEALSKVALDEQVAPENRKKAGDALAKLEQEVANELASSKSPEMVASLKQERKGNATRIEQLRKLRTAREKSGATPEALAKVDAAIQDIEAQNTDIETQLSTIEGDGKKRIKALQDELSSVSELRRNANVEQLKSVDVGSLMETVQSPTSDVPTRQASARQLVQMARTNTDALTPEQVRGLASNKQLLSAEDQKFLRVLSEAKRRENELKNQKTVGQDIFSDQPSRGYISLPKYRSLIEGALQRGDKPAAERSLAMLERFMTDHQAKADNAKQALQAATQSGKQQALVSEAGSWSFRDKGNFWTDGRLRENGGLAIHSGSGNLVQQIDREAKAIRANYEAMQLAIQGVPYAQESANQTESESEAPNQETGTGNGQTAPETVDGTSERTEGATEPTGQRTERTGTDSDQPVESSTSTEGSENPQTGGVLKGRYMTGRNPQKLTPDALVKTTEKVATRFGELQEAAETGAEVSQELQLLRSDLQLLGQIQLGDGNPAIQELFQTLVGKDQGATVGDIVAWARQYGTATHGLLLDKLESHPNVAQIRTVTLLTERVKDQSGSYKPFGMYFHDSKTLGLDPLALQDTNDLGFVADVIVHELVHAVSYDRIAEDSDFRSEIEGVSREIADWLQDSTNRAAISKQNLSALEYAVNDPQELLATVFGSPSLMADLQKIPSSREGNALGRFISAVVDSVRQLFNLNPGQVTMLERVMALGEEVLDTPAEVTAETKTESSPVYWFQGDKLEPIDGQMTREQLETENKLQRYFSVTGKTPLSRERDFLSSTLTRVRWDVDLLSGFIRGGSERVEKLKTKENLDEFLATVTDELLDMNQRIDRLFQPEKSDKYRWANPLSYFVDSKGTIDENVQTAISQAALGFTLENGNEVWFNQTDKELRAVLNLEETEQVDRKAASAVREAGRRQQSVIQELGLRAYQASGLKLNKTAPQNEEQQIIMAMGEMALALLFDKQYFQRKYVYGFQLNSALQTVVDKKNAGAKLSEEEQALFNEALTPQFFVRSNRTTEQNNPRLEYLNTLAWGTGNFLDDLFGSERVKTYPTLAPVKFQQKTGKNSPLAVPKRLAKILDKENQKAHYLDPEMLSTEEGNTGVLHRISWNLFERIAGVEDTNGRAIHKTNLAGIRGKNEALRREIKTLMEDTVEDLVSGDVTQPIYLDREVWKMHRVGIKSNGFNPQASKVHRYAFKMDGWDYAVNTGNPDDPNLQEFKLAVLDAFGKKTDEATVETTLKQFDAVYQDPAIQAALPVAEKLLLRKDQKLTPEEEALVAKAVDVGGENMHSFAGLLALAKYHMEAPVGGTFVTSLIREGDGKTNGPIITNLMAGMPAENAAQNELMNMGGLFTKGQENAYKNYGEYAEKVGLDLYKRLAKETHTRMTDLLNEQQINKDEFVPVRLLSEVIGNFVNDNGNVSIAGRKAVKQPLTSMIFGSSVKGTIDNMAFDFVEGIYSYFEKLEGDSKKVRGVIKGLNQVMDAAAEQRKYPPKPESYHLSPVNSLMNLEFSPAQVELLKDTFKAYMGTSIQEALENQFGEFLKTRAELNEAANMAFRMYDFAYQKERNKLLEAIRQQSGNAYQDLSREQEGEVTRKLKAMFPAIHVAYSKASNQDANVAGLPLFKRVRETFEDTSYKTTTKFRNLTVPGDKKGQVKQLSGFGVKYKYIEPGAGTVVLSAHGHDTYAAAETYNRFNVLNSHDALHGPASTLPAVMRKMNEAFFETMEYSSIPENVMDGLYRVMDEFELWERQFTSDFDDAARTTWEQEKINTIRPKVWDFETKSRVPSKATPEEHAAQWLTTAARVHRNKLSYLSRVRTVSQYYVAGGEYIVPQAKRNELKQRAEQEDLVSVINAKRARRVGQDPVVLNRDLQKLVDSYDRNAPSEKGIGNMVNAILTEVEKGWTLSEALYALMPGPDRYADRAAWNTFLRNKIENPRIEQMDKRYRKLAQAMEARSVKASYRQGSPRQVNNYTTTEVLQALVARGDTSASQAKRLETVLQSVVASLHGPFGAKKVAVEAKAGETAVDMLIRAEQEGAFPFSSRARGAGLGLTKAESYVLEQVELAVRNLLDGKSLADKELIKLYREAKSRIKPADLGIADSAVAKQVHDFIFRLDTDAGDTRSNHISRFVALGLTYPPLANALNFSVAIEQTTPAEQLGDRLLSGFNTLVQQAADQINSTYAGQKANERMNVLVHRLVQIEQKRKLELAKEKDGILEQIEGATAGLRDAVKDNIVAASKSSLFRDSQYSAVRATAVVTEALAEDRAEELLQQLERFRNAQFKKKPLGLFMSTLNEIRGETAETQAMFSALAKAGQIEQERKNLLENTKKEVLSRFENGESLTVEEKSAITQVFLRNDLAALYGPKSAEEIVTLIRDESRLNQEIQSLTKQVLADKKHGGYYMHSVKDLGYFLATGKNVSENLSTNAHQIAYRWGTAQAGKVPAAQAEQIKPVLDQLASLYALKYTRPEHKTNLASVLNTEMQRGNDSGINFLLQFHKGLKADALQELFDGNPGQMMKGYTKEIYNPHVSVVAANNVDGAELEAKGYVRKANLLQDPADSDLGETKALYVLADAGLQDYVTGALSNTGMRARGTPVNLGSSIDNPEALKKWKAKRLAKARAIKLREMKALDTYRADYDPSKRSTGKLAPVYSPQGTVTNYRYLMDHDTKDELLDRNNRFEDVLGGMVSSQYDKLSSKEQNQMVVGALYDFYKENYAGNSNSFVEVSLEASEPRLREAYRLLPEATKMKIKEIWGQDKLFIHNNVLNLVLGYRKYTVADVFDRDVNERNVIQNFLVDFMEQFWGKEAATKVRRAEDMWQAAVKIIKDIWVIRNLTTLLGNVMSNITLLLAYGVPPKKIVEGHREAIEGLLKYQDTRNQLMKLELDQRTGVGNPDQVAEQIRELRFELERNPVHELVQEGMFQTIMEDIDAKRDDYDYKDKLNRTLDDWTGKLPDPVRKVGEVLTVSHNTTLYKLLFKGTQMSDFVGRYVLFNHLQSQKSKPMSRGDALKVTREAFVNYDVPTHRALQYGNDMGLVFFTKYYLRVQKIIYSLFREAPARSLAIIAASNYLGGLANIFESNMLGRVGNNPFDVGAANIVDAADEPIPLKILLSFFD